MYPLLLACLLSLPAASLPAQWTAPTPEELSMQSIPEVPGAPAVYLYREQTTEDALRSYGYYVRLKVLTEGGKEYANVELPFGSKAGVSIDNIAGRTIHPDGTVTPFNGKPYEKLVEKVRGYKVKEKVFTLPAVEVGSILEYRYRQHYDDSYFLHPDWYVQSELFTRKAHYSWKPNNSNSYIVDERGSVLSSVAWTPILPKGAQVMESHLPTGGSLIQLDIADVPPLPKEEYMPPLDSVSYRVLFYYTSYKTSSEYWQKQGKFWSKDRDKFIGPKDGVKAAVNGIVAPAESSDAKLRKLYAFVETLENTDYTRERTSQEEHAVGLKDASSTDDILSRKRGTGDQITELFVAMARAAGFKSYLFAVANRRDRIFLESYLTFQQLDDDLAIVNVDGKDLLFDPGQRYCAYGQLAWPHYYTGGLRQTENGAQVASTGKANYKQEHTSRIADLKLDEHGSATGSVVLQLTGDAALHWRQEGLRGDDTSLNRDLKENLESMLPGGMEVRVTNVDNLTNAEKDLKITYEVKGAVGAPAGKRLLVQGSFFEVNAKPKFTSAKRDLAVDMRYPGSVQDAVRFTLPDSLAIESAPNADAGKYKGSAAFNTSSKRTPNTITLYRNVTVGETIFPSEDYPELRSFYSKLEAKDQEPLVLTRAEAAVPKPAAENR